jgi:hypothetical protein
VCQHGNDCGRRYSRATPLEEVAQFFEGPCDAFLRRIFADSESGADFRQRALLIKTQKDSVAFSSAQSLESVVQVCRELGGQWVGISLSVHGNSLLFASLTSPLATQGARGDKARRSIKPAGENDPLAKGTSLSSQKDEDRLGDLFGEGMVARDAPRRTEDQRQMALNQRPEGGFIVFFGEGFDQFGVIHGCDAI